ncbi:hypothetical protein NHG24_00330 [Aerococcaceae bacterium NML210727]|nr:hypothetical protein [Aerococcaceae bacterium NML210727]MCW6654254.1 hypothetical protein [Aerococcaceae bacterium NML201296]MCW6661027.1 hypothetical protein [Aerococcaceae bacterium NML201209]MCW6663582.1 hypothetical protein [Aerococcaceae bacterium NML190073]MCW6664085.1 hypothetical protein [Aerococcaceae bacterium NML191219]MCW6667038.1 hypothetical protein [Aerococcaceae bacterium NML190938]MCW6679617.1 hypothetical protein [Aerococcaceae bacterium NML130460]
MLNLPQDPESRLKRKRLGDAYMIISLLIQVLVLLSYYFKEKQVALAFPMLLGIFITGAAFVNTRTLK